MAALFSRPFYSQETSFTPLFRLLDDFDSYTREAQGQTPQRSGRRGRGSRFLTRTMTPNFDVRETEDAYELHGELPGVEKENVEITFTEPQTIVIKGRVERTYTAGTPPAAIADASNAGLVEDAIHDDATTTASEAGPGTPTSEHHATVSDEETEAAREKGETVPENSQVAQASGQSQAQAGPRERFWISERSVGEFSRNFSFPQRVDTEHVSAQLQNGILSVRVPKLRDHQPTRISIN